MNNISTQEIYRWFDVFRSDCHDVEIRCIKEDGKPLSGYFDNPDDIIRAIAPYQADYSVYFGINALKDGISQRAQFRRLRAGVESTKDSEIDSRIFVLIDVDPERPKGICSTDEERRAAEALATSVEEFLCDQGFFKPIRISSGNGAHLYLPCLMKNTPENKALVERFLKALDMLFSNESIHVDTAVFNASRIARLPGCWNRKGSPESLARPQRMCEFEYIPEEIKPNRMEYFQKVAALYEPEETSVTREFSPSSSASGSFDVRSWLAEHHIEVRKEVITGTGTRFLLKECPFNPEHGGTAAIFQGKDGKITFYCFHNSCQQYKWKDLRLLYEPDAYSRKDYQEFQYKRKDYRQSEPFPVMPETPERGSKWLSPDEIKLFDPTKLIGIPTGFPGLDRNMGGGLLLSELTVLSGSNGSGKSTWLNQVILNAVNEGFKCALWSGELVGSRLMYWMHLNAAGRGRVVPMPGLNNFYAVSDEDSRQIDLWLKEKLFIYNNKYGSHWEQLKADIKDAVKYIGVKLLVIDNLAALTLPGGTDRYAMQASFIDDAAQIAKDYGVHIIVVCHPRKSMAFLRKEDISGTSNITDLADNVIIIHRANKDFLDRAEDYYGKKDAKFNEFKGKMFDNAIDVVKARFIASDFSGLIGMYFEPETRRMKSSIEENKVYGWKEWCEPSLSAAPNTDFEPIPDPFSVAFDDCPF